MRIRIVSASADGSSPEAALGAALLAIGLSDRPRADSVAVIPETGSVLRAERQFDDDPHRRPVRRCLAIALRGETRPGRSAWAGLGWARTDVTGRGWIVRKQGADRRRVLLDLHSAIDNWSSRQVEPCGPIQTEVIGAVCEGRPICVIVAALCDINSMCAAPSRGHRYVNPRSEEASPC